MYGVGYKQYEGTQRKGTQWTDICTNDKVWARPSGSSHRIVALN